MFRRSMLLTLCVSGWLAGGVAPSARAEGIGDRATAESLSEAGKKLMAQGNYQQACEKLDAAAHLDVSVHRLLKVAECQEHFGQTASSWLSFSRARELADGLEEAEQMRRAQIGVARLEKQLCKIVIVVPAAADIADLEIRKDGSVVSRAVRDLEVAVDPGTHVVSATAPGRHKWSTEIGIARGPTTVTVTIPNLTDDLDYPLLGADMVPMSPRHLAPLVEERGRSQRTVGYVLGGAGLLGVTAGIALGLQASATYAESEGHCANLACDLQGLDHQRSAQSQAAIASTLILLGAASLTGGAIVYFTAPSGKAERRANAINIAPTLAPGTAGLVAAGRF